MRAREPDLPVRMAGGPENPLGARALYLGNTLYRIHGTSQPWTIGQAVSSELKEKEALIVTFWNSMEDHEVSHKSETFQPLFRKVLELCETGNEEIAYDMLWSGKAYSHDEALAAQEAKLRYTS